MAGPIRLLYYSENTALPLLFGLGQAVEWGKIISQHAAGPWGQILIKLQMCNGGEEEIRSLCRKDINFGSSCNCYGSYDFRRDRIAPPPRTFPGAFRLKGLAWNRG